MVKSKKSTSSGRKLREPKKQAAATQTASCCPGGPPAEDATKDNHAHASAVVSDSILRAKFEAFVASAQREGAIPHRTKELMAISLSLLSKCGPCVTAHLAKARALGVSEAEVSEAVWLAVVFGGAPVLAFYEALEENG